MRIRTSLQLSYQSRMLSHHRSRQIRRQDDPVRENTVDSNERARHLIKRACDREKD
ncbi:hypothetical protein CY34DRAFT_803016 [Suillus luteus UH-Slu-Lm8-n1]|uniref:Uncharacterized protein n=1 Tax=Suillus luteus UH-Slu-Lm8-n1 TaxID=930992 RepID=A0A0D0A2D5_9AGAM|nr:hypothetical protein CY34DRAFT_803016 [Suillus luteus UH-Slu-Lm8-n1]